MFQKTSLRLTGIYLLIIMTISLFFSVMLYNLAVNEINRGFHRQDILLNSLDSRMIPFEIQQRLIDGRQSVIEDAHRSVFGGLFMMNIAILVLGGGLSYALARWSLRPIEKAHLALEQFTADASHELRTPLAAMKSEIEVLLMDKDAKTGDMRKVLQSNLEEIDSLTMLSGSLLSIARLEENGLDISSYRVDELLSRSIRRASPLARQFGTKIEKSVTPVDLTVRADKISFVETITIVLDNALKYGRKNSTVTIEVHEEYGRVVVTITDRGIGISPNDLPKVFDRFYRADGARSKRSVVGHGLGLSLAKQLVERQHGTIDIASTLGEKTSVTLTFPSV